MGFSPCGFGNPRYKGLGVTERSALRGKEMTSKSGPGTFGPPLLAQPFRGFRNSFARWFLV